MSDTEHSPNPDLPTDEEPKLRVVDKRWWASKADDSTGSSEENGNDFKKKQPVVIEKLEFEIANKDALIADYAKKYEDATVDFEKTRARLTREVGKDIAREIRGVLVSFLEIIDNLDRAIEAAKTDKQDNRSSAFLEGILLVRNQCLSTFSRYGVTPVLALGLSFDPNIHDALSTVPVPDPSKDNIVITVVKPGYFVNDDLLRPASVIVGKISTQGE